MFSGHLAFYPLTPTLFLCQKHLFVTCNFYLQFLGVRWVNVDAFCCVIKTKCNTKGWCCWLKCHEFIIWNGIYYSAEEKTKKSKSICVETGRTALFCKRFQEKFNFLWSPGTCSVSPLVLNNDGNGKYLNMSHRKNRVDSNTSQYADTLQCNPCENFKTTWQPEIWIRVTLKFCNRLESL